MVNFIGTALVADDVAEDVGEFYLPHRGRQTARGRDGRFYTAYTAINGAGTNSIVRVAAWSLDAVGTLTTHWDFKVADIGFGIGSDFGPPASFQIAMDWDGADERVLVIAADDVASQLKLFFTKTATPGVFTAGDTFSIKDAYYTTQIGLELFGRNGAGTISVVYGNANAGDRNTTLSIIKHRTATAHNASFSAATDVFSAVLWNGDASIAASRNASGNRIEVMFGEAYGGFALNAGLFQGIYNGSSWTTSQFFISASTGFFYLPVSHATDSSGVSHLVLIEMSTVGTTHRLAYLKFNSVVTILENAALLDVQFVNVVNVGAQVFQFRFHRNATITADQDGNAHIVSNLRATASGFNVTQSVAPGDRIEGLTLYWRKVSGVWAPTIPTARKSLSLESSGAIRCVTEHSMPHDVCVVGKLGAPAFGALWVEVACHNYNEVSGTPSCSAPGIVRRIMRTDDYEPGMTRRPKNVAALAQSPTALGPKKVTANNFVSFAQTPTHPGSTIPRSAANVLAVNNSNGTSGGKGKSGASLLKLVQTAGVFLDNISKGKAPNVLELVQTAGVVVVHTKNCGNFLFLADGEGQGIQVANALAFSQGVEVHGTIRVSASNSLALSNGAAHDPLEGCETTYQPSPPIVANTESQLFVSITAPADVPTETITLRRPDLDDDTERALQGEVAQSRSGLVQSTIRTPNPVSWSVTFSGLTRKQTIEFENFLERWRAKRMLYRDHNNRVWNAVLLTSPITFRSQSAEAWIVTLDWEGFLL